MGKEYPNEKATERKRGTEGEREQKEEKEEELEEMWWRDNKNCATAK